MFPHRTHQPNHIVLTCFNRDLKAMVTDVAHTLRLLPMVESPGLLVSESGIRTATDVQRLRGLFDALDRKRDLLRLFDQCLGADGVQIFIGGESGYRVLDECSVVTAPYVVDGEVAGVLGVIGPTRMAYSKIIPLVSETARRLGDSLTSQ